MAAAQNVVNNALYSIYPCTTAEDLRAARDTVRSWVDIQSDRLAVTRQTKGDSEAAFQAFSEDKETFEKYSAVLSYLSSAIVKQRDQLSKEAVEPTRVTLLRDSQAIVQGMIGITIKCDRVYIDGLASAPWNIQMNAPADPYAARVFKGAGKALMAYSYKQAQKLKKPILCTTPLASAFGFYKAIQMEFDSETCLFSYRIEDKPPAALEAYFEEDEKE